MYKYLCIIFRFYFINSRFVGMLADSGPFSLGWPSLIIVLEAAHLLSERHNDMIKPYVGGVQRHYLVQECWMRDYT